ncbi:arginine deiminase family protein, partial [Lysinibacillus sp. D4B1_S16]|uniref:arginine deiminase family protein n=1 Tax=Lysinibacillus sp. D4B1_S16 TaxID=2941231 RepID=UPI0028A23988
LLVERDMQLVEVPKDAYDTIGCNVLALAPRVCVIPEGNTVTKQQLIEAGARVFEYKGQQISVIATGRPTC